ncbi:MAG: CRISPR-associated CARF protein Csa3 [Sphaerochaetaceae bacterium]|nr:CRISPR-associated CARF protein Csa3 [Sphaerochaetaceae bacterium]
MQNILIATIFHDDSIRLGIKEYQINKAILLQDENAGQTQKDKIKQLLDYNKNFVEFQIKEIPKYEIEGVVKKCIEIIDSIPNEDNIIIDITQGKRTQTIGLLFAAFKRFDRIKKIYYGQEIKESTWSVLELPKFRFDLTEKQKIILKGLNNTKTINEIITEEDISRATVYNNLIELENQALIQRNQIGKEVKYELTEAGRIMLIK